MKSFRFVTRVSGSFLGVLVLVGAWASPILAQQHRESAAHGGRPNDLIKIVRESTERFRDVAAAEEEGYKLMFGCVVGDAAGAMGLHYVNESLIGDDVWTRLIRRS